MKKRGIFLLILIMALVFGMTLIGCPPLEEEDNTEPPEGNTDPKTLVITMPASIFAQGEDGFSIGIFTAGTTSAQAERGIGLVAGVEDEDGVDWFYSGTNPVVLTVPLYNIRTMFPWRGNGIYDVYGILRSEGDTHYYKVSSVNISSAVTYIQINSSNEIFDMGGVVLDTGVEIPSSLHGLWSLVGDDNIASIIITAVEATVILDNMGTSYRTDFSGELGIGKKFTLSFYRIYDGLEIGTVEGVFEFGSASKDDKIIIEKSTAKNHGYIIPPVGTYKRN